MYFEVLACRLNMFILPLNSSCEKEKDENYALLELLNLLKHKLDIGLNMRRLSEKKKLMQKSTLL